jgi:ATP-dependent DNA helicase PIF1
MLKYKRKFINNNNNNNNENNFKNLKETNTDEFNKKLRKGFPVLLLPATSTNNTNTNTITVSKYFLPISSTTTIKKIDNERYQNQEQENGCELEKKTPKISSFYDFTDDGLTSKLKNEKLEFEKNMTKDQSRVIECASKGENVFYTGSAGTGKSSLLKYLQIITRKVPGVYATAPTGLAAIHISGTTIYYWAGIGLGNKDYKTLLREIKKNKAAYKRWMDVQLLIIDEISMIDADLFDKLNILAQNLKNNGKFFGGIQVIICGDFLQLPPISNNTNTKNNNNNNNNNEPIMVIRQAVAVTAKYCFQAKCWNEIKNIINLQQVFRQKELKTIHCVNQLRHGILDNDSLRLLESCVNRKFSKDDGIIPTILYMIKKNVESKNNMELMRLKGTEFIYEATTNNVENSSKTMIGFLQHLKKNCPAPERLILKINAQVMLLKNLSIEDQLINGSRGVIIGFQEVSNLRLFNQQNKQSKLRDVNYNSNHDNNEDDNNEDEKDENKDENKEKKIIRSRSYPIVKFSNGIEKVIVPETWEFKLDNRVVARIRQIPLMLAWALTVHKCQGMTLDRVEIDLNSSFENGQIYVAISRARSFENMSLKGFDPSKIKVSPIAKQFYQDLLLSNKVD